MMAAWTNLLLKKFLLTELSNCAQRYFSQAFINSWCTVFVYGFSKYLLHLDPFVIYNIFPTILTDTKMEKCLELESLNLTTSLVLATCSVMLWNRSSALITDFEVAQVALPDKNSIFHNSDDINKEMRNFKK